MPPPMTVLAVGASQIKLPLGFGPLGDAIDELDFGATVKGAIPSGKLADALAAWRDAGGKIELDNLRLKWGGLDATANGTIALDQELQPTGGFSGAIEGYDQILTALVQNGQMRATDAGLARIALNVARQGRTGRQTGDQDRIHDPERTDVPRPGKARQGAPYHLGIAAARPLRPASLR